MALGLTWSASEVVRRPALLQGVDVAREVLRLRPDEIHHAGGRSVLRKALELPLALWIDLILPKRRVLEIYLNIAEWGPNGEFGAEAGARFAFGKPASALTAREAALLAAVLPNPLRLHADRPSRYVLSRRDWILDQMRMLGGPEYLRALESERASAR